MLQQGLDHSAGFTSFTTQMNVGVSARPSLLQDSQPTLSASNPAAKLIMQMVATGALDQKKLDRLLALAKSSPEELRNQNIPEAFRRILAVHGPYLKQMAENQQQTPFEQIAGWQTQDGVAVPGDLSGQPHTVERPRLPENTSQVGQMLRDLETLKQQFLANDQMSTSCVGLYHTHKQSITLFLCRLEVQRGRCARGLN